MSQKPPAKKFTFGFPAKKKATTQDGASSVDAAKDKNESTKRTSDTANETNEVTVQEDHKRARSGTADTNAKVEFSTAALEGTRASPKPDQDDDDDPLDAFMADMTEKAKTQKTESRAIRDDLEEEDDIESYVRHMKTKGVVVGQGGPIVPRDENADSDEEVYATAAAIDAELSYGPDDRGSGAGVKREIEPLARVDHDEVEYDEIEKCFYEEHPEITALSPERVREIREELDLHVRGSNVAKPCISFAHFGFDQDVMRTIQKAGFTEPSVIQKQAIPVALQGRDIIGIAKTGSGKTAAFVLPMLVHIMDQQELVRGDGPIGIILAPTRELVMQIYTEAKKFAKAYNLKVAAIYGGASKMEQFKDLRSGTVEIIVATPGRLIDMIKMKATNLKRVSYLVLDEADRMFDLGFEPQVRSISDNVRPDRQTLLFSATFQKRVEYLAREATSDAVRINVGNAGQANEDITQKVVMLDDEMLKWDWLMERLPIFCIEGNVIIFVSRKGAVDILSENLSAAKFLCGALHGDLQQFEREKVLRHFRAGKLMVLIATDVAARGLDIKSVKTVVNYDLARDIDSHVHRVGRTGRAGEKGTAFTLVTKKDDKFAGDLVRHLEASGQPVIPELMDLAMTNPRFRKSRQYSSRGGRGRGRGRGDRGRGRGRAGGRGLGYVGGSSSTGTNSVPVGSRGGIRFQKASSAAAGADGLHSISPSSSSSSTYNAVHPRPHEQGRFHD